MIYASMFAGFELAGVGAIAAGCEIAWGIELDPEIAEVSRQLGHQVINKSVLDVNFSHLEKPDILWASPPCPNFSVAKTKRSETDLDLALAEGVATAIETFLPQYFILENVEGYKRSKSLEVIRSKLTALGYWHDTRVVNSADFGVPQTRKRLILRAIKGVWPVPGIRVTTKGSWLGWYGAIADLLPSLPEAELAEWQLKRMPEYLRETVLVSGIGNRGEAVSTRSVNEPALTVTKSAERQSLRAVLVESKNANQQYGDGLRWDDEPATTVVTDHKPSHQPKALLLDVANTIRDCTIREDSEPSMTVTAEKLRRPASSPKALLFNTSSSDRGDFFRPDSDPAYTVRTASGGRSRAAIDPARVVRLDARCMARFQTLPDWYELPAKSTLACKGIGNGVPCNLATSVISSLIA